MFSAKGYEFFSCFIQYFVDEHMYISSTLSYRCSQLPPELQRPIGPVHNTDGVSFILQQFNITMICPSAGNAC